MQFKQILVKRRLDAHKQDFGHVLVIGGSRGLTGAACLASFSSLRIGAGLVTAAVPQDLNSIFESKLTEVMTLALPSQKGILSSGSFNKIKDFILKRKVNVLALGPGLFNTLPTQQLVTKIIKQIDLPIVLDADGINAISSKPKVLKKTKPAIVLTPHLGEFSRLIKIPVDSIRKSRKVLAKDFALRYNLTLVLKGYRTIVTEGRRFFENHTGNPGMATAGSGDVLTGIIAGLIAQTKGCNFSSLEKKRDLLFEVAKLGVYLHGKAADFAVKEKIQACLIASDIIEYLPKAIRSL